MGAGGTVAGRVAGTADRSDGVLWGRGVHCQTTWQSLHLWHYLERDEMGQGPCSVPGSQPFSQCSTSAAQLPLLGPNSSNYLGESWGRETWGHHSPLILWLILGLVLGKDSCLYSLSFIATQ